MSEAPLARFRPRPNARPNGEGMFRFVTMEDAMEALVTLNSDYERHCRAARALTEAHFDARRVTAHILEVAL